MNQMVSDFIEIAEEELPKTLYVRVQPDFDCAGLIPVKFFKLDPPELNSTEEDILLCENQQDLLRLIPALKMMILLHSYGVMEQQRQLLM